MQSLVASAVALSLLGSCRRAPRSTGIATIPIASTSHAAGAQPPLRTLCRAPMPVGSDYAHLIGLSRAEQRAIIGFSTAPSLGRVDAYPSFDVRSARMTSTWRPSVLNHLEEAPPLGAARTIDELHHFGRLLAGFDVPLDPMVAPTPDGSHLFFASRFDLYQASGEGRVEREIEDQADNPVVSPDGRFVAYWRLDKYDLRIVDVSAPAAAPVRTIEKTYYPKPRFSADSRTLYVVTGAREKDEVILGGCLEAYDLATRRTVRGPCVAGDAGEAQVLLAPSGRSALFAACQARRFMADGVFLSAQRLVLVADGATPGGALDGTLEVDEIDASGLLR